MFDGWYNNNEFVGDQVTTLEGLTEDVTLYAKWEIRTYTVTFNSNSDIEIDNQIVEHMRFVNLPSTEKYGYELIGWFYLEDEIETEFLENHYVLRDYDLYAKWIEIDLSFQVEVTFEVALPYNTPEDAEIYLATNLENWTIYHKMNVDGLVARLTIELTIPEEGFDFQYKFTRGDSETYEVIYEGEYEGHGSALEENRHYVFNNELNELELIDLEISKWFDNESLYYDVEFIIYVEDTRDIQIAGNFDLYSDEYESFVPMDMTRLDDNLLIIKLDLRVQVGDEIFYQLILSAENEWEFEYGDDRRYGVHLQPIFEITIHYKVKTPMGH